MPPNPGAWKLSDLERGYIFSLFEEGISLCQIKDFRILHLNCMIAQFISQERKVFTYTTQSGLLVTSD